jgi:hypothetical protein
VTDQAVDPKAPPLPDGGELSRRLRGHRLPGGEFTVTAPEARVVGDMNGTDPAAAHPVFACVATLRSMGISIRAMCELCEFDLADGPLLGECEIEFEQPLQAGVRYVSTATIESFERVPSRRFGWLDRLRFVVALATADGAAVARVRYLWLLPRARGAA